MGVGKCEIHFGFGYEVLKGLLNYKYFEHLSYVLIKVVGVGVVVAIRIVSD